MENIEKKEKRPVVPVLIAVVVSIAAFFVPFAYLVLPALYASALIRCKKAYVTLILFLPALVFGSLLCIGTSYSVWIPEVCSVLAGIFPGIAIWQMQKRNKGGFWTSIICAGSILLCLYCSVCLPGILSGEGAFTRVQASIRESAEGFRRLAESMRTPETASLVQNFNESLNTFIYYIPSIVVPSLIIMSSVLGLVNFLFFRLFIKKIRDSLGISPLLPFSRWSVPKSFTPGFFILLLGSLIMSFTRMTNATGLNIAISALLGFPLLIQGLSVIDFLIARSKSGHKWKRTLIYIGAALLSFFTVSPLITIGCFEQLFRFRERISGKNASDASSTSEEGNKQ